jgi:Mce-associated membrane protein
MTETTPTGAEVGAGETDEGETDEGAAVAAVGTGPGTGPEVGSGAVETGPGEVAPATPRARVSWRGVGAVTALAVLALIMALIAVQQRANLHSEQARDRDLRRISGDLVAALTTYDYQHLDLFQKRVLASATGGFRRDFNARFPALRDVLVADHSRATGTIQDVFVGPIDSGRATTLVRVIYTVTGLTGTRQIGSYDTLTVLKVNGRWQVDDIQTLLFNPGTSGGSGAAGPGSTGSTPSTTAPASTSTSPPAP